MAEAVASAAVIRAYAAAKAEAKRPRGSVATSLSRTRGPAGVPPPPRPAGNLYPWRTMTRSPMHISRPDDQQIDQVLRER